MFTSPTLDAVSESILRALESSEQRRFRNEQAWHYFRNDMYPWLKDNKSIEAGKAKAGLPQDIASYFNPVPEIVKVDTAKVFSMPVRAGQVAAEIDTRLNAIWTRSSFESMIRKYVQAGSSQGTVYLHVVDGKESKIIARRADEIDVMKHPQTGEIIAARLSFGVVDPLGMESDQSRPGRPTGILTTYSYDLIMTPDYYATYRNGQLWRFSDNPPLANGEIPSKWPNRLGFVPIEEVLHMDDGEGCGYSAWESIKETIDAANSIATFMANTVKMHIDPLIVFYGVQRGDVEKTILNGQTNVFYITAPDGTNPKHDVIAWQGNTADVQGFIAWIKDRLVDVIPELQLARIQEQAAPSGYSVQLQSMPLADHIDDLRTNYHRGLIRADKMALLAEDIHNGRVDPVAGRVRLHDDTYKHTIEVGPLLPVNKSEAIEHASKLRADGVITRLEYLRRVGYSDPDAKKMLKDVEAEAQANADRMLGIMQTQQESGLLNDDGTDDGA